MKILKQGEKEGSWKKVITCTGKGNGNDGCGAELEINGHDLMHTYSSCMGEGSDWISIECPCCNSWNDIKGTEIPYGLVSKVMKLPLSIPRDKEKRFTLANTSQ